MRPTDASSGVLDVCKLTLGVIGPWSLPMESQDLVHDGRGVDRFLGWEHQLHNGPAVQFAIERKYKRFAEGAIRPGWGHDLVASHAVRLGNIETAASVGLEGRFGWNLPNDFGSYPIRAGAENRPTSSAAAMRTSKPAPSPPPPPGAPSILPP